MTLLPTHFTQSPQVQLLQGGLRAVRHLAVLESREGHLLATLQQMVKQRAKCRDPKVAELLLEAGVSAIRV